MPEKKNLILAAEEESLENVIEILIIEGRMMRRNNVTTAFSFSFPFSYVRDSLLMVINDVDAAIAIVLLLFSFSTVFFFMGGEEYIFMVRR